jgi:outer membrane lipoprotein-sorting protein
MHSARKILIAASVAMLLLAARTTIAAPVTAANLADKDRVLRKLDAAARNFHTTAAEFQFDSVTTDPIPDKDTQKGVVYYERKGTAFHMAAHIREENGKTGCKLNPSCTLKIYGIFDGVVKLDELIPNQVTTLNKIGQYGSWFMLGFGASGKDLEEKWEITYLGPETLDGVKTERLELVAKDPAVRKNLPKVTVWMDTERGVSLKQVFDEGPGQYRVSVYFNIKVNQPLPSDAFTLKTNAQTQYVNR